MKPCYLYNGNTKTGQQTSLYWDPPPSQNWATDFILPSITWKLLVSHTLLKINFLLVAQKIFLFISSIMIFLARGKFHRPSPNFSHQGWGDWATVLYTAHIRPTIKKYIWKSANFWLVIFKSPKKSLASDIRPALWFIVQSRSLYMHNRHYKIFHKENHSTNANFSLPKKKFNSPRLTGPTKLKIPLFTQTCNLSITIMICNFF